MYVSKDKHSSEGMIVSKLLENRSVERMYLLQQHAIDCTLLPTGPNPFQNCSVPSPPSERPSLYQINAALKLTWADESLLDRGLPVNDNVDVNGRE